MQYMMLVKSEISVSCHCNSAHNATEQEMLSNHERSKEGQYREQVKSMIGVCYLVCWEDRRARYRSRG